MAERQRVESLELSEARAMCALLRVDCRGNAEVEALAHRRAVTLAELLRVYVDRELRARRC